EQSIMVFGGRKQQLEEKLQHLIQSCKEWQSASSEEAARAAAERAQRVWPDIKSLYPKEALQILPPLWSCPMHQELMKTAAGNCPDLRHASGADLCYTAKTDTNLNYPRRNSC